MFYGGVMNLEKGKSIFFKYYGNSMYIDGEVGDEYDKCGIPKEYEIKWKEEIKKYLLTRIELFQGQELCFYVVIYTDLIKNNEAIDFVFDLLKKRKVDTVTSIILLEHVKELAKGNASIRKFWVKTVVNKFKSELMSSEITIDPSYMKSEWCDKKVLSKESIRKRIEKL